ncbi:hypothetical protein MARBORIA2_02080 [Methanobrevibacter arboriphilus]|jgi:hypothetical protein|uniref:zinc chelation protein SecC n=1 Tax=Methanobrevibacter arboriphilus TaxID=39441 RepID=UPI0022EF662F|nr:zinc chelation protein SecC [Methanobrevibacter arboriphilus]GLI11118.1 hypothetical protein MARBORIA2_02080 [Methanobrevibacter arboriphilus]
MKNIENNLFSGNKNKSETFSDNYTIRQYLRYIEDAKKYKKLIELGIFNEIDENFNSESALINLSLIIQQEDTIKNLVEVNDKFNSYFSSKGWITYESLDLKIVNKAVELAEESHSDQAEDYLTEAISKTFDLHINLMKYMEEFRPRFDLIKLAHEDYFDGKYHSSILLLFTIIDGIIIDCKYIEGNKGFFAKDDENLFVQNSIAAHITGLSKLRTLFNKPIGKTITEKIDIPYRNGIIHGRILKYDNKKVATKLWNTLFALREGIVAIKNKEEKSNKGENSLLDFILDLESISKEHNLANKYLNDWKPRRMIKGVNFSESGSSIDYEEGTPEKKVVEFFEYWQSDNFGNVAKVLISDYLKKDSINNLAGKLRQNVFKGKKIVSYKILDIIDDAAGSSKITAEIEIQKDNKNIIKELIFTLLYENENGIVESRASNNGEWGFVRCFDEIKEI